MYQKNFELRIREDRFDAIQFGSGSQDLVLITGLGDGITTVRGKAGLGSLLYRKYARQYRVTIISRKNTLEPDATTQSMAKDQYYAMQALGIRDAYVIGVSMGGMIAQHLAADHPDMVRKLVLVVTEPAAGELMQENIGRWIGFAQIGAFLGLMIDITEKAHPEKYLKRLRPFYPYLGSAAKKLDIQRFCIQARACASHDATEKLDRIQCPTLVIGGGRDRTLGDQGSHLLHRFISESTLRIYEDQGHALYEDEPDFLKTVLAFLKEPAPEADDAISPKEGENPVHSGN